MSSQGAPQGYKKTKAGVIPEDWEVVKLGDVCQEKAKYGINAPSVEFNMQLPNYLRITDIDEQGNFKPQKKTSVKNDDFRKFILKENELVLARTGATVGKSYLYNKNDGELVYAGFLIKISPNNKKLNSVYLKNYLFGSYYWHWVKIMSVRSGQPGINAEEYSLLPILLPPLKEQQKIANILTTWDDAISKQNELIKAKEELKKGLMQKLLSGKVRFNEFDEEWIKTKLSNYITEISKKNKDKKITLVLTVSTKYGFISQEDYFDREIASKDTSNYKIVKKGDFAYNPSRINIGSISYLDTFEEGILSPMYVIFKCNDNLNSSYFTYWLNTHSFKGNLYKYLSGSVRDSLSFKDMKLMKIKLPSLQEQQKIAEVLSNADKEISSLQSELEELKKQKKGLMQKLLTGEVRVRL